MCQKCQPCTASLVTISAPAVGLNMFLIRRHSLPFAHSTCSFAMIYVQRYSRLGGGAINAIVNNSAVKTINEYINDTLIINVQFTKSTVNDRYCLESLTLPTCTLMTTMHAWRPWFIYNNYRWKTFHFKITCCELSMSSPYIEIFVLCSHVAGIFTI